MILSNTIFFFYISEWALLFTLTIMTGINQVAVYPSLTTGKKEGTILLTCLYPVKEDSTITSIYWVYNDGMLPNNARSDEDSNSSLTIRPFRPDNAGKYSCIVDAVPETLGKGDAIVQYGRYHTNICLS